MLNNLLKKKLSLILFGAIISISAQAETSKPFIISIVPQFSAITIHKDWTPVLKKLTEKTGLEFELLFDSSIPNFEVSFSKGIPDFVFLNPYHMLLARKAQGYIPLVRDSDKMLTGRLFVKNDSPIMSINDLNGKTLAFPAPNAYGASLLIQSSLKKNNIEIKPVYVSTHSNVYRAVLMGDVMAGGGVNNTFQREPDNIKNQLRLLYETQESAPHPLAAHPRIAEAIRHRLTTAFIELSKMPENMELFKAIQMSKPVEADFLKDYQPLEALRLEEITTTQTE